MQITSINYKRTYNLGNYSSESIGLDADLELGENPETAMASLKKQVEELHRQNNPQLWGDEENKVPNIYVYDKSKESSTFTNDEVGQFQKANINYSPEPKTLAEQIRSCKELKVLETYKFIIKKDVEAKQAYDEMLKKLGGKEKIS